MQDPIILAVDTSTSDIHIGICKGTSILLTETFPAIQDHSRLLLTTIENCLKKINLTVQQIDVFASTIGPGSFTGVRTGLGIIKGLAFSLKKPIISISTLQALAHPCTEYNLVVPVLDARKDSLYAAVYEKSGSTWREVQTPQMIEAHNIRTLTKQPAHLIGKAGRTYASLSPDFLGPALMLGNSNFDTIHGKTLCEIAHQKYLQQQFEDVSSLELLYIQKTAAEGYV